MKLTKIKNPELAFQYCKKIAKEINEFILQSVTLQVLEDNKQKFLTIKGSDWQHHNYAGGLIVHTCNVTLNAISLAEFYKEKVNIDLVKFCALMHDVGKLFDYEAQQEYVRANTVSMNQALLGHSFEGASYISKMLENAYSKKDINVSKDYICRVVTQVSHCIGAHMDGFGACSKQQMYEVLIIGCADKVDSYLEQTVVDDNEYSFAIGTGETFYKASVDPNEVLPIWDNPLQEDLQ